MLWKQGCGECTLARKRAPIYAEEMSAQDSGAFP